MNPIFSLAYKQNDKVVLKVNADDNLVIALNPFINSKMDYITVTRGENHTLTVINKDGSTWSFNWGVRSETLISENTRKLKEAVIHFIEKECHIMLEWNENDKPTELAVFFNSNFNKYEFILRHKHGFACMFSDTAKCLNDMTTEAEAMLPFFVFEWVHQIAETGINTLVARF